MDIRDKGRYFFSLFVVKTRKFIYIYIYRRTPISTGNTFQELPRFRETTDNTEHYILRDITYQCNIHKYGKVELISCAQ